MHPVCAVLFALRRKNETGRIVVNEQSIDIRAVIVARDIMNHSSSDTGLEVSIGIQDAFLVAGHWANDHLGARIDDARAASLADVAQERFIAIAGGKILDHVLRIRAT